MLETFPALNNRLGAKDEGEGGVVPVGGVIANAVAAALASFHAEPRQLPFLPENAWPLMTEGRDADC